MTPALLTELKRLDDAATESPWRTRFRSEPYDGMRLLDILGGMPDSVSEHLIGTAQDKQAQLIVALRNSAPALLEAVETMHAALEGIAEERAYWGMGENGPSPGAELAQEALARVAALLGEGREK